MGKKFKRPNNAKKQAKQAQQGQAGSLLRNINLTKLTAFLGENDANQLAKILSSPRRVHGLAPHLRDERTLTSYLKDVFCVNDIAAGQFAIDLIQALLDDESDGINKQVPINSNGDASSLLGLLCQWKQLEKLTAWKGKSEMVKIVLAHPKIRVNDTMPNGCNAAFFCVKYGDLDTLNYVIDAGCNLSQKDHFGRTLLYNTLEYPKPDVLKVVLDHVSPSETFPSYVEGNMQDPIYCTAADILLSCYAQVGQHAPLSWRILGGPPPVEDVAECLILLKQRGVKYTYNPKMSQWDVLSLCFESNKKCRQVGLEYPENFKKIGELIFGSWLPVSVQKQMKESEEELFNRNSVRDENDIICVVCQDEIKDPVKLYCGHSFCSLCIIQCGKHQTKCPICYKQLCLDVSPDRLTLMTNEAKSTTYSNEGNVYGNWMARDAELLIGLMSLTDEQIVAEAEEYGIDSQSSSNSGIRENLITKIKNGHKKYFESGSERHTMTITKSYDDNGAGVGDEVIGGGMILETTATVTISNPEITIIAPVHGPVCVEVAVKGIPVIASISNNSRYTIVSSKFRKTFGLKQIPNLTTSEMRCGVTGKRISQATCLKEFSLTLNDSVITLQNVLECDSAIESFGIQLGQDFFLSARYCSISVSISDDNSTFFEANGTSSWIETGRFSESLRYYTHDGKIVRIPLLHLKSNLKDQVRVLTVKEDSTFRECSYCCRTFPKWKASKCCDDDVHYCDKNCRTASKKVHMMRKPDCCK